MSSKNELPDIPFSSKQLTFEGCVSSFRKRDASLKSSTASEAGGGVGSSNLPDVETPEVSLSSLANTPSHHRSFDGYTGGGKLLTAAKGAEDVDAASNTFWKFGKAQNERPAPSVHDDERGDASSKVSVSGEHASKSNAVDEDTNRLRKLQAGQHPVIVDSHQGEFMASLTGVNVAVPFRRLDNGGLPTYAVDTAGPDNGHQRDLLQLKNVATAAAGGDDEALGNILHHNEGDLDDVLLRNMEAAAIMPSLVGTTKNNDNNRHHNGKGILQMDVANMAAMNVANNTAPESAGLLVVANEGEGQPINNGMQLGMVEIAGAGAANVAGVPGSGRDPVADKGKLYLMPGMHQLVDAANKEYYVREANTADLEPGTVIYLQMEQPYEGNNLLVSPHVETGVLNPIDANIRNNLSSAEYSSPGNQALVLRDSSLHIKENLQNNSSMGVLAAVVEQTILEEGAQAKKAEKKSLKPKGKKRNLNGETFQCCWDNCREEVKRYLYYLAHVGEHIKEVEMNSDVFVCLWAECNFECVNAAEMVRHINYHPFHSKLKLNGEIILKNRKLRKCQLDSSQRNVVPELMEALKCEWEGCDEPNREYDHPQKFYWHVYSHVNDYLSEKPKDIVCKWGDNCSRGKSKISKIYDHLRGHIQEKVVGCPTCGAVFASNAKFIDHCNRQHTFHTDDQDPDDADDPIRSDQESGKFTCTNCNKTFLSERLLRAHISSHINHYKCNYCNMTCPTKASLNLHMNYKHNEERPFPCSGCDYKAKSMNDLKAHMKCHAMVSSQLGSSSIKVSLISCQAEGCKFTCATNSAMEYHVRTRHVNPSGARYACHICPKIYTRGNYLSKHLKSHKITWPDGHSRFRYRQDPVTGMFQLQTIRYESADLHDPHDLEMAIEDTEEQQQHQDQSDDLLSLALSTSDVSVRGSLVAASTPASLGSHHQSLEAGGAFSMRSAISDVNGSASVRSSELFERVGGGYSVRSEASERLGSVALQIERNWHQQMEVDRVALMNRDGGLGPSSSRRNEDEYLRQVRGTPSSVVSSLLEAGLGHLPTMAASEVEDRFASDAAPSSAPMTPMDSDTRFGANSTFMSSVRSETTDRMAQELENRLYGMMEDDIQPSELVTSEEPTGKKQSKSSRKKKATKRVLDASPSDNKLPVGKKKASSTAKKTRKPVAKAQTSKMAKSTPHVPAKRTKKKSVSFSDVEVDLPSPTKKQPNSKKGVDRRSTPQTEVTRRGRLSRPAAGQPTKRGRRK